MTRKKFIGITGLAFLGSLSVFQVIHDFTEKNFSAGNIRLRPVDEALASVSFKKFCQKARFRSLEEAVRKVRHKEPFIVYQESEKDFGVYGRPNANAVNPCENSSGVKRS